MSSWTFCKTYFVFHIRKEIKGVCNSMGVSKWQNCSILVNRMELVTDLFRDIQIG